VSPKPNDRRGKRGSTKVSLDTSQRGYGYWTISPNVTWGRESGLKSELKRCHVLFYDP
jgi:hypothetical protein